MSDSTALSLVDPGRANDWTLILLRTREMLEAADSGDWERVVVLESDRRESLTRFFATAVAPYETQQVKQGIEEILAMDGRLLALTRERRTLTKDNIVQLKQRVSAHNAYEANALG